MSVDDIASPSNTEKDGVIKLPGAEKETASGQMSKDDVGIGVDGEGFWHFVIHSGKGIHSVVGFLEMSKDAVKAHYIGQMRTAAEQQAKQSLLRPSNIDAIVNKVKGKFRR